MTRTASDEVREEGSVSQVRSGRAYVPHKEAGSTDSIQSSVVSDSLRPHGLRHARQSITNSRSSFKLMSIESMMSSTISSSVGSID